MENTLIGIKTKLIHDLTEYQYGSMLINGKRYCARCTDSKYILAGTEVELISEHAPGIFNIKVAG